MSFLDSPTSPSQTSPSSSTSAHDSLNSFPGFPGIAETNLTTVLDDTSKQLIVPPSPSTEEQQGGDKQEEEEEEDVVGGEEQAPLPKAPPAHRRAWRTESMDASTSASTTPVDADAYEEEEDAWKLESPGAGSGTTPQTPTVVDDGLFSFSEARVEERSPDSTTSSSGSSYVALPGRFQSAEKKHRVRSYSSSSSSSSGMLGLEYSSSSSPSSDEDEEEESPSSTTEREKWTSRDAQSAVSSIPRIHIEAESLLFSHSPPRLTAKDKGKGKETVTWEDAGKDKGEDKGKGKERERDLESEAEPFVRDVQRNPREKVQIQVPAALPQQLQRYHRRRKSSGMVSKIRTRDGVAVFKYQEQGLSRDFALIIGLCFGLACAFVLVARPAMLSVLGRPVGFSLDDLD